jgi:hypothetical protein
MVESSLTERYSLINHHRIGYGGTTHVGAPVSILLTKTDSGFMLTRPSTKTIRFFSPGLDEPLAPKTGHLLGDTCA